MKAAYVRTHPIPEEKQATVKELAEKMKKARTILIASMRGLPSSQFHDIKKKLRGTAELSVAKKKAVFRAIDMTEKGALLHLKKEITADFVLFFSAMDPFELSGVLADSQSPTKARTGDLAPEDIAIEPGPTDLVPGPAISELSSVGLRVAVKEGKIEIMQGAVVAKKGAVIKENVAAVLSKLGMAPMRVGFIPVAAYDAKDDKVYVGITIDKAGTLETLREMISKSLGFAAKIGFPTKETISYFIAKAAGEEKAMQSIVDRHNTSTKEGQ